MTGGHWLVDVARRAALPQADTLAVAAGTPAPEAWAAAERHCGVAAEELARHVATHYRAEIAELDRAEPHASRLVPESFARRFLVVPLRENDRQLQVATSDPTDIEAEQALAFASGRTVVFRVAPPDAIRDAIDARYAPERSMEKLLDRVDAELADAVRVVEDTAPEHVGAEEADAQPVVRLTNMILREAVTRRVSDIHVEPGRGEGTVRFRVDGVLHPVMRMPMAAMHRVVSRIKILGKLNIADRVRPQDGRTRIEVEGHVYELRISTVPTREAEKAVVRVLDPEVTHGLEDLGLQAAERDRFRAVLRNRDGIVAVTGPTGSGKTTTLYGALREVATSDVNIMTVEDPVEYELPGITQIQVQPKQGVTFASALRAILRQDPDVILVGEIRDLETATVAVQAAMTGHLVLATLHTNDAVGAISRMVDLGLDRASVAASLRGAVAQRLLRRVCPECRRPADRPTPDEARLAAIYGVAPMVRAVGCDACARSGYLGRVPVQEVLIVTPAIAEMIAREASEPALEAAAVTAGMRRLRDAALERLREGETTLQEIDRVLGEAAAEPTTLPSGGGDVLVVDDDAVSRGLARTLLAANGFQVHEAGDGEEALDRLRRNGHVGLVVLDLDMPRMGGRDVLRAIRADPATARVPVVVLTGTEDAGAEAELMEQGADDYIRKPIDPPRFVARVKAALRRARA